MANPSAPSGSKHAAKSKTVLGNLVVTLAVAIFPAGREWAAANPEGVVAAMALLNIVLRAVTKGGVHWLPKG